MLCTLNYELMRELIGLNDKDGTPIREGDIVEFFFDEFRGYGDGASGFTRMIDVVEKHDDEWLFVSQAIGRGAYAWRHNRHCRIIGNIHKAINKISP